jgi:predicted metal-dependent phosphoesterase TrpH
LIMADLHIHTTYSDDSTIQPKILVEQLFAHPFVKVAAVTDHDTVEGLNETRRLAAAYPDILIIPGVEISTPEGDIVILGAEELPPKPWTVKNVVALAKNKRCISVAAHPFREYGLGDATKDSGVDAIEILNGGSAPSANKMAQSLAREMQLPAVGGSDAHTPSELFSAYNEIQAGLNVDEILRAIKKGLVTAVQSAKSTRF